MRPARKFRSRDGIPQFLENCIVGILHRMRGCLCRKTVVRFYVRLGMCPPRLVDVAYRV